jgi:hypothetical protein
MERREQMELFRAGVKQDWRLFVEKMKVGDGARRGGVKQPEKGLDRREKMVREKAEVTENLQALESRRWN